MQRFQDYISHGAQGFEWDPFNGSLPSYGFGHWGADPSPDEDLGMWDEAEAETTIYVNRWRDHNCGKGM